MKTIVLVVSWRFPMTHSKRGKLTHFAEKITNTVNNSEQTKSHRGNATIKKRKIHTIRLNYDRWKHNIDKIKKGGYQLSVREWENAPYRSKQRRVLDTENVDYQRITMSFDPEEGVRAVIDGKRMTDIDLLAKNDGLTKKEFIEWFFGENPTEKKLITGIIIHFTDFKYEVSRE